MYSLNLGGSLLFTATSEFKVPGGKEYVRAIAVGGGGGGHGGNGGGGGSGKVDAGTIKVIPGSTYQVTVGAGGAGWEQGRSDLAGSASSFLNLKGDGGWPSGAVIGGNGGSGGGGGGHGSCIGGATAQGGIGGSAGKTCTIDLGGTGQGSYSNFLSMFTKSILTAGQGGEHGLEKSSGTAYISGGGAGGVLIDGKGPQGGDGSRKLGFGPGARGGIGYGAGGGGGGYDGVNYSGGNGASGMVYIEWD